jgi:hypothetical protein
LREYEYLPRFGRAAIFYAPLHALVLRRVPLRSPAVSKASFAFYAVSVCTTSTRFETIDALIAALWQNLELPLPEAGRKN